MNSPQQLCGDMLVALPTILGGGNMQLSRVGASPWYAPWNKEDVPTAYHKNMEEHIAIVKVAIAQS